MTWSTGRSDEVGTPDELHCCSIEYGLKASLEVGRKPDEHEVAVVEPGVDERGIYFHGRVITEGAYARGYWGAMAMPHNPPPSKILREIQKMYKITTQFLRNI